jgi:hypothetical protein
MNVISLDQARSRLRGPRPIEPPSALSVPGRSPPRATDDEAGAERLRMRQNLAAFAVIIAIVGIGSWLIDSLQYYSRLQACVEARHHNCLPLKLKYLPSPYER